MEKNKKILIIVGSIVTIALIVFAIISFSKIPTLKNGEEVIATIDGKKFTADDLYNTLKKQGGQAALINMIDEIIINKEVKTDEDAKTTMESQFESYKSSYENSGQNFSEVLASYGYANEDDFKNYLILQYKMTTITENYIKANLTDAEIDKYYDENVYGNIEAKHILITPDVTDDMSDEEKEKAENKAKETAEKLIKKLDKGSDFEKLAKENSEDSGTASNGGKLTVVYGEVVDEFWNATNSLKDGKYTKEPVKSEYGYHVIYRESQKEKPTLKEVREDVIEKIVAEKLENNETLKTEAMVELRKKYKLNIKDNEIKKAYNTSIKEALAPKTE